MTDLTTTIKQAADAARERVAFCRERKNNEQAEYNLGRAEALRWAEQLLSEAPKREPSVSVGELRKLADEMSNRVGGNKFAVAIAKHFAGELESLCAAAEGGEGGGNGLR